MNKYLVIPAVLIVTAIGLFTCKETSTEGGASPAPSFLYRYGKCFPLPRFNISDSIFVYSFTDSLIIDFSVSANCCPDSNRFTLSHTISDDTIFVSVVDTAENSCRCFCPYMIQTEFSGLPNDHYVVNCSFNDWQTTGVPGTIYLVDVYRKKIK